MNFPDSPSLSEIPNDYPSEKVKFFGEDFTRETFESLCERKATSLEFALNGFIVIKEGV